MEELEDEDLDRLREDYEGLANAAREALRKKRKRIAKIRETQMSESRHRTKK